MKKFLLLLTVLAAVFAFGTACDGIWASTTSSSDSNQESPMEETELKTMDVSLASKSFDYDGNEHSLAIDGELPENAVVAWQNNSLKDVGEQLVFATVKCQGYKEVSLKATLTVVGRDMPAALALENATIGVEYGAAYAFSINDEGLLPTGAMLTETYIDMSVGEIVEGKPDFGGEFRYVLQITAPGYNVKTLYGNLTIARPDAVSVAITNLPSVPASGYKGTAALLPGFAWVPEVEILPKGHKAVEIEFTTADDTRISYENGAFVGLENYGDCEITVSIKGTAISQTYTVSVADCDFYYEDFENASNVLYIQEYVMEKDDNGQMTYKLDANGLGILIPRGKTVEYDENGKVKVDQDGNVLFVDKASETYYGAYASIGTTSEIASENGNSALHVSGLENFGVYYSFFEIDGAPDGEWKAGKYRLEMDVTGDYAFTFFWVSNEVVSVVANSGTLSNAEAIVEDGKIVIEFTVTEALLSDNNTLRFAQSSRNAFDFTVDNIKIVKIG